MSYGLFGKKLQKPINADEPTQPYIGTEVAVDDSIIYKRLKITPYSPDDLFTRKGIKIFWEMMKDPEIEGAIFSQKIIRLSSGWNILPASENPIDITVSNFVKWNFENIQGSFNQDLKDIMNALHDGASICELIWDNEWNNKENGKYNDKIKLQAIKSKNPRYFNLKTDDFDNILSVVNISSQELGREYDIEKFAVYSYEKQYENVWGKSVLRSLYDYWYIKQIWMKSWGIYLEKFGQPHIVIKHPKSIDLKSKKELMAIIKQVRFETGFLLPETVTMEVFQNSITASEMHSKALEFLNNTIRKKILGETLTSQEGKSGSYGLGKVHFDILLMFEEGLGLEIADSVINKQIIKRLVDYNYKYQISEYPKFVFNSLIKQDAPQVIDKYIAAVQSGIIKPLPEDENWMRKMIGAQERKVEQDIPEEDIRIRVEREKKEKELQKIQPQFMEFQERVITGVRRRTFTPYEQTTNFSEIKDTLNLDTDNFILKVTKIIEKIYEDLMNEIRKKKIIEDKNISEIEKLQPKYIGDIKTTVSDILQSTFTVGVREAKRSLIEHKKELKKFSEIYKFQQIDLRALKPAVVQKWIDSYAYSIAGAERDKIARIVKSRCQEGIKYGYSTKEVADRIQTDMDIYFSRGEIEDKDFYSATKGGRLESIADTATSNIYNYGRRNFYENPELEGYVESYQLSGILDDRIRPNHAELDGLIFAVTDSIWDSWFDTAGIRSKGIYPPNGWRCRCLAIPTTADDKYALSDHPKIRVGSGVDAGFSF